jgi:3'(2'), 5'-bisphosphate nucleotidase
MTLAREPVICGPTPFDSDASIAYNCAWMAARFLADRNGRPDKAAPGEVDKLADQIILEAITMARPEDAVLTEEAPDDLSRLHRRRVWIVDPLDGSTEYYQGGKDWAVHVALVEDGVPSASAVVAPERQRALSSSSAFPPAPPVSSPLRIALSKSRPDRIAREIVRRVNGTPTFMSSAGVKTIAVIDGLVDAYIHSGGQYEWDSAAPVGIALAAGLHVSRLDGRPLVYNQQSPYIPDILICSKAVAPRILGAAAIVQ